MQDITRRHLSVSLIAIGSTVALVTFVYVAVHPAHPTWVAFLFLFALGGAMIGWGLRAQIAITRIVGKVFEAGYDAARTKHEEESKKNDHVYH